MPNGQITSYSVTILDLKRNVQLTILNTENGDQRNFTGTNLGMSISNNFDVS